jgi:type IV pilus assembly protein PilQ
MIAYVSVSTGFKQQEFPVFQRQITPEDNRKVNGKFPRIWIAFLILISIFSSGQGLLAQPSKRYTGRKISLDFRDADIRNIFRLIAEVSGLNIVIGGDLKGRVTIRLVEVPWDQALEVVLQSQSLGMVRAGNVIRIAPIEKLRKEEETRLASKRAQEKMEDLRTEMIHLKYAIAKDMVPVVRNFLSERGTVGTDERTNTLIIRDIPENIETIKNLFR